MDRQREALPQLVGEAPHFFRLNAFGSAHAQRITHHYRSHFVITDYALQLDEIKAFVLPMDGFKSLRGYT